MTSHIDSLTQQDNVVTNDVPDTRTASEPPTETQTESLYSSDESSTPTVDNINTTEHSFSNIDQELDSLLKDKPYEDKEFDSTFFSSKADEEISSPSLSSSTSHDDNKEDKEAEFDVFDANIYLDDTNLRAGEKLGKIREAKDLSLPHIANKLYLNPHVIEALENGEYSQISSPIFVRGYLRNYAKFLDVDPEPIIEQVNKELGHQPLPQIIPQAIQQSTPTEATHRTPFMLISSIIIAVIMLVMMGLWASSPERNFPSLPNLSQLSFWSKDSTEENDNGEALTDPNFAEENSDKPIPLSSVGSSFQTNGEGTVFTPPSEAADTNNAEAGTTLGQPVPLSEAVSTTPLTDITTANPATSPSEPAAATTTEEAPVVVDTPDLNTISIHFANRTWTSVLDSTGKEFFGRTAKAGSEHSFTGTPPFRLKFGIRSGVTIDYAGEKIDFASSAKRRGKRITIGQAAE